MRTLRDHHGRPSLTARAVAAGRAIGYLHLYDPLAVEFLPAAERVVVRRARTVASRAVGADAVAVATGGVSRHAALRMAAMDTAVAECVQAGAHQIVIVGAGYDTRAWRLGAVSGRTVWELDLPGTQRVKRRALSRVGEDRAADKPDGPLRTDRVADVRFVEVDLASQSVTDALVESGHDTTQPTAWVWEAVAPYLTDDAVRATLADLRAGSAPGSHLAMTFAGPVVGGSRTLSPVTGALASIAFHVLGEPILSSYDKWEISTLLTDMGFADPRVTSHVEWSRQVGLSARPDPLGIEMMVTAHVRS